MTPAMGIKAILEVATPTILSTTWPAKVGRVPKAPDQVVVLMDSGGRPPEVGVGIDYPNVQVIVRGSKDSGGYLESYNKALDIKNELLAIPSAPTAWPELTSCVCRGDITAMGYDENDRPLWSLNLALITTPTLTNSHRE